MKIAILGTSGSGKSTLAKRLGETYGLPVLHMDTVHFLPGWVERPFEEEETIIRRFLDENAGGWVIDGNYTKTCYARRLEEADKIIVRSGFRRWSASGGRCAACGRIRGACGIHLRPGAKKKSTRSLSAGSSTMDVPPKSGRRWRGSGKSILKSM